MRGVLKRAAFFLFALLCTPSVWAAKDTISGQADATFAERLLPPRHPSSEAVSLSLLYKTRFDFRWSGVLGLRQDFEFVYEDQPDFNPKLREDSHDLRAQDIYAERRSGEWQLRVGWQQVAWGETFGNSPADVVNPKDLRHGLPLDQSKVRLATPMINLKKIGESLTWEALVIPEPQFNVLPLPGSDYFPPLETITGFSNLVIERQRGLPVSSGNVEGGGRLTGSLGVTDLSVFFLNSYDRSPSYEMKSAVPGGDLVLRETHSRVNLYGTSLAADLGGFVLRAEGVATTGRLAPAVIAGRVDTAPVQENAYAVSLDFPSWDRLNFAAQLSGSVLSLPADYLLRPREIQNASIRALLGFGEASTWETIAVYGMRDKGTRLQTEIARPLSENGEWRLGVENQGGPRDSDLGRLWRASRAYVSLRFKFSDEL